MDKNKLKSIAILCEQKPKILLIDRDRKIVEFMAIN